MDELGKKKLKKIIAREGIIILSILLIGGVLVLLPLFTWLFVGTIELLFQVVGGLGVAVLLFGYPAYLVLLFVFWAIKTLRDKR